MLMDLFAISTVPENGQIFLVGTRAALLEMSERLQRVAEDGTGGVVMIFDAGERPVANAGLNVGLVDEAMATELRTQALSKRE